MKRMYITFLLLVLVLAMVVPVAGVYAASPQTIEVNGTVCYNDVDGSLTWEKMVGRDSPLFGLPSVWMGTIAFDVEFEGSIDGEATSLVDYVLNTNTFANGGFKSSNLGEMVFDGTIDGEPASFTALERRQTRNDEAGTIKVELTITGEIGENTLRGTLVFELASTGVQGEYSGEYSGLLHATP